MINPPGSTFKINVETPQYVHYYCPGPNHRHHSPKLLQEAPNRSTWFGPGLLSVHPYQSGQADPVKSEVILCYISAQNPPIAFHVIQGETKSFYNGDFFPLLYFLDLFSPQQLACFAQVN